MSEPPSSQENNSHGNRRWYDDKPRIGKAITSILTFPHVLQSLMCDSLLNYVKDEEQQFRLSEQLHSVGSKEVLALYKAQQKRREYDQQHKTRDILNGLGILPDSAKQNVAGHILKLSETMVRYLKLCKNYAQVPEYDIAHRLIEDYQIGGIRRVYRSLDQIEARFETTISPSKAVTSGTRPALGISPLRPPGVSTWMSPQADKIKGKKTS